jgi:hypothetical protein
MNKSCPIPIAQPLVTIRMEVDRLKTTLLGALMGYELQLKEQLEEAVEEFCAEGNLRRIIQATTYQTLRTVIEEEVRNWYTHGQGREAIKEAVRKRLDENTTYSALDDVGEADRRTKVHSTNEHGN